MLNEKSIRQKERIPNDLKPHKIVVNIPVSTSNNYCECNFRSIIETTTLTSTYRIKY